MQYGLWDQIRVDCGKEFALLLYVQQLLAAHRTNTLRQPYMQTRSTRVCVCVHMYMYVCVCRCMLACACLWYNVTLLLS